MGVIFPEGVMGCGVDSLKMGKSLQGVEVKVEDGSNLLDGVSWDQPPLLPTA